jgi:excisionase family DNA binding protein
MATKKVMQTDQSIVTISVKEAAAKLRLSTRTIRNWLNNGKLTRYEICGHPRVDVRELQPQRRTHETTMD